MIGQDADGEGYEEISSDEANLSDFDGTDIDRTLVRKCPPRSFFLFQK